MRLTKTLTDLAKEVKQLHDRDEALAKTRAATKIEQRDVRLKIGSLVDVLNDEGLAYVAEQSGYAVSRLKQFADVRRAWPDGSFPTDVSFTPLEELQRDSDRFTKIQAGMSKRDAREARGGKVDTPSRWSSKTKAEFVAEVLNEPDVANLVADAVMSAQIAADAEAYRRMLRSGPKPADDIDTVGRLASEAHAIARKIDAWTEGARDLTVDENDKEYLLGSIEEVLIAAQAAKAHIQATDAAFATLLEEHIR